MSSSTGIVESREKGFVLDLKFLFTIVDCFSGRFPPRFFTVKLVGFIGFPRSSYLVLFNNLCSKLVNSINWGLYFPTSGIRAGTL